MKKSQRYLRGTVYTLVVAGVLLVGANRLYTPSAIEGGPERTSAAELAALRDFDSVEVSGDLSLTVRQQPTFAVEYQPLSPLHGQLHARVEGRTLLIQGYGNRSMDEKSAATLVIGLPQLEKLYVNTSSAITVEDFTEGQPALRITGDSVLVLRRNSAAMVVDLFGVRKAQLDALSYGHARVRVVGETTLEPLSE